MTARTDRELDRLHQANAITVETLELLSRRVEPGMTTLALDRIAARNLKRHGVRSAFKGYRGFPATLCVSVNNEVVHGIPSRWRRLRNGDIVSLDFGCIVDGYYGDNAITVPVGEVAPDVVRLLEATEEALHAGIAAARPGSPVSAIGTAVSRVVERRGYSVVREYGGHGIGTSLHSEPFVPNFRDPRHTTKLVSGGVIAIEPMVNRGGSGVRVKRDRWTVITRDGSLSAHFERSIAITDDGAWILAEPRGRGGDAPDDTTVEGRKT